MLKQTFEESFDFIRMDEATVKANRKEDLLTIKQESSNSETETSSTTTPPELTKFNAVSLEKTSDNRIKYELQPTSPTSFLPNSGSAYNGQIVGVEFYKVFNECNPGLKAHRGRNTVETNRIKITQMKNFVQQENFNDDDFPMKLYIYQEAYKTAKYANFNLRTCVIVRYNHESYGDSIIESLLNGGIILNPANEKTVGGGMYSRYKKALEENLCFQSNLATSLLLFVHKNYPGYKDKEDYYLGKAGTSTQKCLLTENLFKYIKYGTEIRGAVFKKLRDEKKRVVLSIASLDATSASRRTSGSNFRINAENITEQISDDYAKKYEKSICIRSF